MLQFTKGGQITEESGEGEDEIHADEGIVFVRDADEQDTIRALWARTSSAA